MVPFLILAAALTLSGMAAAQEPPSVPPANTIQQQVWRGTPIRNWAGTEVGRLEVTA